MVHPGDLLTQGVHGEAKIDHFSSAGRVRGTVLYYAVRPARLRFDVLAPPPFQSVVSTLTSDGEHFALLDLREKRLYEGAASACNLARLTDVPVPGHALVSLLSGSAPMRRVSRARVELSADTPCAAHQRS